MALNYNEAGELVDDGQPTWIDPNSEPLKLTVTKAPFSWVDATPAPLRNPDATPADIAAYRMASAVKRANPLPVADDRGSPFSGPADPARPSYIMEPDLQEAQGGMQFPPGLMQEDSGRFYYQDAPQVTVPMVRRPNVLPVAMTPEGLKFVTPRVTDIVGNVMGNVAAPKVAAQAGEMVLGSGAVRTMQETPKIAPTFYSALENAVKEAKVEKADASQWLGYLRNQPGVKAEEINTVLKELPEGQISKNELENIVKQNKVELKETVKGGDSTKEKAFELAKEHGWKSWDEIDTATQNKYLARVSKEAGNDKTKYHSYQLPGGENYKEMLMSLPSKGLSKEGLPEGYELINETKAARNAGFNVPVETPDRWVFRGPGIGSKIYKTREEAISDAQKHAVTMDNAATYKSSHWDEPNILAHIRMNDRYLKQNGFSVENQISKNSRMFGTKDEAENFVKSLPDNLKGKIKIKEIIDGHSKKSLHIEEIQSDWHQAGRKNGYQGEKEKLQPEFDKIEKKIVDSNDESIMSQPDIKDALKMAVDKKIITDAEASSYRRFVEVENGKPVPDAPFKRNWDELALKRIIRHAAENGYEGVSWTPGEAQAARYDLSKQIRNLSFYTDKDGQGTLLGYDHSGNTVLNKEIGDASKELPDIVGKEVAEKLLNQERKEQRGTSRKIQKLENADLKIGAEGMKAFYDKMLVDRANGIAKKYGSKVEQREVGIPHKAGIQGQDLKIHYLPLTPALKSKAMNEGFSLFSSSPTLSPVSYNPFDDQSKKKYRLTPVSQPPVFE